MKLTNLIWLVAPFVVLVSGELIPTSSPDKDKIKSAKLPPCSACASFVKSFENGIERTARGRFDGGDTAWEEKNQKKGYAISEVRFVEIQETVCRDVARGESQCHDNHHNWEESLEEWWSLGHEKPDLKKWLCEDNLKVCCPDNHYGSKCDACKKIGENGQLCSGRGRCKGSGTRKGNGNCQCDIGFSGDTCDQCAIGFFQESASSEELKCTACHKSCLGQCTGSGPTQCLACKEGYLMHSENGCVDFDECNFSETNRCKTNEFCVNTEGSFTCVACDKSCASCEADGPDSCIDCAEGFLKNDNVCVSQEVASRIFNMTQVRYLTYGGLFVATAIIFQRSTLLAGGLGLVVVAYISLSEYYLQGATGELRPIMQ